jgi:hypothetical protein
MLLRLHHRTDNALYICSLLIANLVLHDTHCLCIITDGEIDADGAVIFSHMVIVAGQHSGSLPYNQRELQRYILLCAQQTDGGLRDKVYSTLFIDI